MQNIADDMLRIYNQIQNETIAGNIALETHLTDINIDIENIVRYHDTLRKLSKKGETIPVEDICDIPLIHKNLEEARKTIIKIESHYKHNKL